MRSWVPLFVAVVLVGCGASRRERPPLRVTGDAIGAGTDTPTVAGPPDAGSRLGHGADLAARFFQPAAGVIRVPESDRTPPLAMLRLDAGAKSPIVHDSPVRRRRSPTVSLVRARLAATALVRDADGGTGRVRVSIIYATRCAGVDRQHGAYFPPAQIAAVRVAPGVRIAVQRTRRATLDFDPRCEVFGKLFAEATNATGLESFSDPIWFRFKPRSAG
jgi:hypothetical protein